MGQYLRCRKGYFDRVNRVTNEQWLQTREIVYYLANANVTREADLLTREEILPLPSDKAATSARPVIDPVKQSERFFAMLDSHLKTLPVVAEPTP